MVFMSSSAPCSSGASYRRIRALTPRLTKNAFFLSESDRYRTIPSDIRPSFLSTSERFALRFLTPDKISRPLRLCSDQYMRRNWTACHAHLFTVFDKLYSPQMVVTIYKYAIENDLTKKREKRKKKKQINE